MAKNVKITEDGSTKIIENAARIRTSLEGGGTCDWIPKDDVPLQELTVTEDGVYRPEEDYYGFSKVTANGVGNAVEGDLIEKTVTKNGTYNITDESGSPYGYSKIIVNVDTSEDDGGGSGGGGSSPVVGKDEDGNDTMAETDDDGNVVITALPTEIKVIIPPTKLDYTRYEEIDYSGISVYAYISKMVHWLGTTTTAVSEGSSNITVSIGGNSVTASVGDGVLYAPDRTGANDIQLVWDGTKWVKPGDYSAEKAIWKSDKYPTGKIPFEELIFPISRINNTDEKGEDNTEDETNKDNDNKNINMKFNGINKATIILRYSSYNNVVLYSVDSKIVITFKPIPASCEISFMLEEKNYNGSWNEVRYWMLLSLRGINTVKSNPLIYGYSDSFNPPGVYQYGRVNYYAGDLRNIDNATVVMGPPSNIGLHSLFREDAHKNGESQNISKILIDRFVYDTEWFENKYPIISGGYSTDSHESIVAKVYDLPNASDADVDNLVISLLKVRFKMASISLPVQWKRPGDGKILETTFTAWMKDDGDNNASGSTTPGSQNIDVPQ